MNYKLEIDMEAVDALFTCVLRDLIETTELIGDDPERDRQIIAACKLLLDHFGKPYEPSAS